MSACFGCIHLVFVIYGFSMNLKIPLPIILFMNAGSCLTLAETRENNTAYRRPIIGIVANELYYEEGTTHLLPVTFIAGSYVKFAEAGGAQVVPIMLNSTKEELKEIFAKINGLILPGGYVEFHVPIPGGFHETSRFLLQLAKEANEKSDHFPVWAVCQGIEYLAYESAMEHTNSNPLTKCNQWNKLQNLKFTLDTPSSRLYRTLSVQDLQLLATRKIAPNMHNKCISVKNFRSMGVSKEYILTAISKDDTGPFVASMEHKRFPFFGFQYHPEKNTYEWSPNIELDHSPQSIALFQRFALFFVDQCRKSKHSFSSFEGESRYLIYNYRETFTGKSHGDHEGNKTTDEINLELVEPHTTAYLFPQDYSPGRK